jgi:hypothetical protein
MISRRHYKMGNLFGRKGILNNVGDILQARITHDNKKILTISRDNGNYKYSRTEYANGTIVKTTVMKKRK